MARQTDTQTCGRPNNSSNAVPLEGTGSERGGRQQSDTIRLARRSETEWEQQRQCAGRNRALLCVGQHNIAQHKVRAEGQDSTTKQSESERQSVVVERSL